MTMNSNRCPVCGKTGYQKAVKHPGDDAVFYCRAGHPHYVPRQTWPPS